MKRSLAVSIAALCACASSNIFAQPVIEAGAGTTDSAAFAALRVGSSVLFDQTSNASGNSAPVQNFEPGPFDAYDSAGADDFDVADEFGWVVDRVNFVISQSNGGSPTSVDVAFHANSVGGGNTDLPGAVLCSYLGIAAGQTGSPPSAFNVELPQPCALPQGRHWVSLTVNQNFGGGNGQVFWSNRTVQSLSEGAWINPGNGFGNDCTTFTPMTVCGVGGGVNPDFLFQIVGVLGEPIGEPEVTITGPTLLDFGVVTTNTTSGELTTTITNSGDGEGDFTWSAAAAPFTRSGGTCTGPVQTLAAGASCTLSYTYSPTAQVPASQQIGVQTDGSSASFELRGQGRNPAIPVPVNGLWALLLLIGGIAGFGVYSRRRLAA